MPADAEMVEFDDVLKVLSVSPERLEDLVISGELVAFRRGRAIRFRKEDVAKYLVRHGGAEDGPSKLGMEDRKAKAVAAKIASLRRSRGDDASALLEKLGAGGEAGEELISVKEKLEGRGARAAPADQILVQLQKELVAARRKADRAESEKKKLTGQLQLLDALKDEVKQVAVLARENEALRGKLSGRQADVQDAERIAQTERECNRLREQLKGAEDALAAVQEQASEVSSLRAGKRELEQKLDQAREQARASLFVPEDEQVQRAMAHADELASDRKKLLDEIEDLRKQSGKLEARLSAVEAERDGAVQKLKDSKGALKTVSTKDEDLERLEKELAEARGQLDSAREDAASELKTENESLKSELAELRGKLESSVRAEGQLEELRSEAEKLRSERDELREELRGAQVTLGHMRADTGQAKQRGKEIDEARREIRELRKEHDQTSARALAAEAARDQANNELESLSARVNELEGEAGAASGAREEAQSLRTELDSVKAALEEEKKAARTLEEEKARAQEERESEASALKEEMAKLQGSLEETKAGAVSADELSSVRAELDEARSRSAELEGQLQEATAAGREELESARSELEEARTRSSELERELEEAKAQVGAAGEAEETEPLRAELEEARSRCANLERELEEAKTQVGAAGRPEEIESLRAELEEARSRSSDLEGELEDARRKLQEATASDPEALRSKLEAVRAQASELDVALEETKAKLKGAARAKRSKKLVAALEEARSRERELEGELSAAEAPSEEVDRLREELESARAEKDKALDQAEALRASGGDGEEFRARLDELSAQLAEARKDSDSYRLELSRKEGALAALQAQLERARVQTAAPAASAPAPAPRHPAGIMLGGGPLPPDVPKRVGRFTFLGLIGMGRKGWVCTASSPYVAGVAAVRILPQKLAHDARFMEHFIPRIRRVAELENKSIVDVLDTGEFPGGYFVAMELVGGGTLRERLEASERIEPGETLAIIMQLTKALEVVRRAELVHRDIRPENVLFTPEGTPKLSDLGLSLGTDQDGCSVGRGWARHYAAPEQLRGEETDCRADVFSLGAMAYEMLTGRPAFQAGTPGGAASLYDSAVLDRPECSPGFALAVTRMLCKSPEDRYASPKDLATDLILLSDGREPKASAPGEEQSFIRPPAPTA